MYRIVTIKIPKHNILFESKDLIQLNTDGLISKVPVVSQPIFEVLKDCNGFLDPAGLHDGSGARNLHEFKAGQRVELLACNLNTDTGYSPFRYTFTDSNGDKQVTHLYIRNENVQWISGNLGIPAGDTPVDTEEE